MDAIKIEILHPSENKKQLAEIPDNAPTNRIVSNLVRKMGLSLVGPSGERINYKLQHKESGRLLDDNETPDGIILNILKLLVKILLIPVKLAIKLTGFLLKTTWNLFTFTIRLILFVLPPYNFGSCNPC